jgi:hypothetical protein
MFKSIFLFLLVAILFGGAYVYWNYYNSYSEGNREGMLYKFSRKGNVYKTYEGEMIQPGLRSMPPGGGINTNNFSFSVENQSLADSLENCLGKTVKLHYVQYRKALPWRGEDYTGKNAESGQYIIDKIESISTAVPNNAVGF